jgi:hypothetical protein
MKKYVKVCQKIQILQVLFSGFLYFLVEVSGCLGFIVQNVSRYMHLWPSIILVGWRLWPGLDKQMGWGE